MANILLVEDEAEIRQIQRDYLKKAGHTVHEAEDGQRALDLFDAHQFDLIVLDLNLPVLDGLTVSRSIRKTSQIPIIMVTAKTSEIDELQGFKGGADDYVKKPFSPKVLVARIETLLKRPQLNPEGESIKLSNLEINTGERQVYKKGKPVSLTPTQFNILLALAQQPGRAFSREELMQLGYDQILPPDIYDRTIDTHIKNIRKVIESDSKDPKIIMTVRGYGYKVAQTK